MTAISNSLSQIKIDFNILNQDYTNFRVESGKWETGTKIHYRCICKSCSENFKEPYVVSGNYFDSKYGSKTHDGMVNRYVDEDEIKKWSNNALFYPLNDNDGKGFYVREYRLDLVKFGGILNCEICNSEIKHNPNLE